MKYGVIPLYIAIDDSQIIIEKPIVQASLRWTFVCFKKNIDYYVASFYMGLSPYF